jgi:hypothetical protein
VGRTADRADRGHALLPDRRLPPGADGDAAPSGAGAAA